MRKGKGCPEGDEGRRVEERKGVEPHPAAGPTREEEDPQTQGEMGRVRKGKGCPEGDEGRRVEEGKGGEPHPAAGPTREEEDPQTQGET